MIQRWKIEFANSESKIYLFLSFLALIAAFYFNNLASGYADDVAGEPVKDLLFSLLPKLNVDFVFHYIALLFWILILLFFILFPKNLTFVLLCFSGFVLLRSGFIILTHLGPPEGLVEIPEHLSWYTFQSDLFFSGHVGAPFLLGFLVENRFFKTFVFSFAVCMIIVVLVGRFHYSIDVFASIFIAHSYYVICLNLKSKWEVKNIKITNN